MYYLCLDDHHATKLDADGAVVASGIVAQLPITHQLLNGHRTSTHNWHKVKQAAFQLGQWYTYTYGGRNHFLRVGLNLT